MIRRLQPDSVGFDGVYATSSSARRGLHRRRHWWFIQCLDDLSSPFVSWALGVRGAIEVALFGPQTQALQPHARGFAPCCFVLVLVFRREGACVDFVAHVSSPFLLGVQPFANGFKMRASLSVDRLICCIRNLPRGMSQVHAMNDFLRVIHFKALFHESALGDAPPPLSPLGRT